MVRAKMSAFADDVPSPATRMLTPDDATPDAIASARGAAELTAERPSATELRVRLAGDWRLAARRPGIEAVRAALTAEPVPRRVVLEASAVSAWDSALVAALLAVAQAAGGDTQIDLVGVPPGAQRLLELTRAVPPRSGARRQATKAPVLDEIGVWAIGGWRTFGGRLGFLGATTRALGRACLGRARYRGGDFVLALQQAGHEALPIAGLISFLLGAVLAFVGAVQLQQFGAAIFVANLVGIAVVRETAALMTGIVMAGRTGASYAAVLGTMTVGEEVDALETLGLDPIEYLVGPRVLALAVTTPLLVVYADVLGVLGGLVVGVALLDLGPMQYLIQTQSALSFEHVAVGLVKSLFFGILVALIGCYHGLRSGRSALAVGAAATAAVVGGILAVVVCDAAFTLLFHVLGI
jgi:phospholipid/cholesterol/gamma-HCH transport system permease protein